MSRIRYEEIACPKCGHVEQFRVWVSINSVFNEEEKELLLEGDLFRHKCSKCGNVEKVFYETFYHDIEHKVIVHLVLKEHVEETGSILSQVEEELNMGEYGVQCRIVTTPNELMEKAIIFDNGLDDRVIELVKVVYHNHLTKRFPEERIKEMYFFPYDEENAQYGFAILSNNEEEKNVYRDIRFSKDFYDEIKAQYITESVGSRKSYVIDRQWALQTMILNVIEKKKQEKQEMEAKE